MNGKTNALTTWSVAAALALTAAAGPAAAAQADRQKDKNTMRNVGSGLGAGAVIEALRGNTTNALILGAGAAYSAKKYEDARKAQSRENARRARNTPMNYRRINVVVNEEPVRFSGQKPQMVAGNVYVPLRGVLEEMGATVQWDAAAKRIVAHHEDKHVVLPLNGTARVNGQPVSLDTPAYIANGQTMIPLRFMAETFGAQVSWDPSDREVRISDGSQRVSSARSF